MKLIKYLTRNFTLLEHSLIARSVMKKSIPIPELRYRKVVDIYKNNLIDVYVLPEDKERQHNWILKEINKNRALLTEHLKKGIAKAKQIVDASNSVKIERASDKELITELEKLRKAFNEFGLYLEFTHYIGMSGMELTKDETKMLSYLHEFRKKGYLKFFNALKSISKEIGKIKGIENIDFLTFDELISFLTGRLSNDYVKSEQEHRKKNYLAVFEEGKDTKVITKNFNSEYSKINNIIIKPEEKEIKGKGIGKGKVIGEVAKITQLTSMVKEGKIIVTTMTNPDIVPMLRKSLAIITDEGGILCHAANVAREFGIIAVIGTKNATEVLKDGDLIEVDADKGVVRKI